MSHRKFKKVSTPDDSVFSDLIYMETKRWVRKLRAKRLAKRRRQRCRKGYGR